MKREEAIERLKQNKAAAEFYVGIAQNTKPIENELKDIEAFDMAIEALQGDMYCPNCGARLVQEDEYLEPTQTHGRLIDADELMGQWDDYLKMAVGNFPITPADITQIINDAPTVQADRPMWETCFTCPLSNCCPKIQGATNEDTQKYASEVPKGCPIDRPHGEWIDKQAYNQEIDTYVSWIECSVCGCAPYYGLDSQYNFCPNCGADMRKEKE